MHRTLLGILHHISVTRLRFARNSFIYSFSQFIKCCYIITSFDPLNPVRYCLMLQVLGALEKLAGNIMKAHINVLGDYFILRRKLDLKSATACCFEKHLRS